MHNASYRYYCINYKKNVCSSCKDREKSDKIDYDKLIPDKKNKKKEKSEKEKRIKSMKILKK